MFGDLYCSLLAKKNDLVYKQKHTKRQNELNKMRNEVIELAGELIQTDRDFTRKLRYLQKI